MLGTLLLAFVPASPAGETIPLEFKTYREWDIVLPAEQFARVSGGFSTVGCTGEEFAAKLDGTGLKIDTDGDGEPDTTLTGKQDDMGNKSALVTLRGKTKDGKAFTYSARLVDTGAGWTFAASGAMVGRIGETKIQLIDQDNNGRYDDFGEDAMIVGRGKVASFLSRAVNVGGEVFQISVSEDGSELSYAPFEGEVGTLDMKSELDTKAKLMSVIVRSTDGQYSFDLARVREGLRVPAGTYLFQSAKLGLGESLAYVRPGRIKEIEVAANDSTALAWGGPLEGEFKYAQAGGQIMISPADVTYFGRAGEEYFIWDPVGKSPEFSIIERKAGTELTKAMFPGSS